MKPNHKGSQAKEILVWLLAAESIEKWGNIQKGKGGGWKAGGSGG